MTWRAVALSRDIEPGTATDMMLDGRERVIWRDAGGTVHVWADRCPHRGMRMSFGFVRGDRLACLYHGWQYDGTGRCRLIPAHPELDVPGTIHAETFPAIEWAGFVWVWSGSDPADGVPPVGVDEAEAVTPVRSLVVEVSLERLAGALAATDAAGLSSAAHPVFAASIAPNLWRFTLGHVSVLLAGHSIAPDRAALHVVMTGSAGQGVSTEQVRIARWCEALRDRLEAAEAMA